MEDWVVLSDSDGDSVELHDGSDVGSDDNGSESSFAVVQVRGRAAPAVAAVTPAALPQTIAVEAVPQPSPSPPGFFKPVSYKEAFSGIASEHGAASSHAPVLDAAEECSGLVDDDDAAKNVTHVDGDIQESVDGGDKEDASCDAKKDNAEVSPVIVGGEHENAEISDVAESQHDHVDSKIAAKDTAFSGEEDLADETGDDDIKCFDEEDRICEENPDDEIFDDDDDTDRSSDDEESDSDEDTESTDEESDYEEEDTTDLESDSDEDSEITDEESDCEEEIDDEEIDNESGEEDMNLDDELMGFASGLFADDDSESFHDEEDLDDDESLDDDDIECYDVEDRISEENPDDEIFDDESMDTGSSSEQESDCDEESDGEEEQPEFDGGNKYDAIDNESFGEEESICVEQSDVEDECSEFAGVPVIYDDIDTEFSDSDMEIEAGEVEYPEFNGGVYDDIDSEIFDEEESICDEQSDDEEEEPEEFAGGGYGGDYESVNGEEYLVLPGGDIDNESFGWEESVLDNKLLDFLYGAMLYDHETESCCDEVCERVCVCGLCMELIDGDEFYQLTGDEFESMQLGSTTASSADEEEPSDAGDSDDDTAHEASEAHGDSADMADGNSAATRYGETLRALYAAAAAEPASTPSQFQQAMEAQVQHAVARDLAAAAMVRAADAIDWYMQADAAGLAAQDVEALSQGATSLRAIAAAPSFALGVGASNAAPPVRRERARARAPTP